MKIFKNITGFEWDEGNKDKNFERHHVDRFECEEVFFNEPLVVAEDEIHSKSEIRYYLLGRTNTGRRLFLVFTIRGNYIRVISARDMSKKERHYYEIEEKNTGF